MNAALRRRLTSWLACFAIVLNALAPAISQALAAHDGRSAGWVEICSAAGVRMVAADDSVPADDATHAACPFCVPHAGSCAVLPGQVSVAAPLWQTHDAAAPPPRWREGRAWRSPAQPRAPPTLS